MRFTRENAREFSRRGNLVRWSQPPPAPEPPRLPEPAIAIPHDDFVNRKVLRVRAQIERVSQLLDKSDEPQAVDRFANALTRLYELERVLAGRPLPGSRRPAQDRAPRAEAGAWSAEPLDVPAQVQAPPLPPAPADIVPPAPAKPLGWEYDDPASA